MLLPLLFLSLSVLSVQASPVLKECTDGNSLGTCSPLVDELKTLIARHEKSAPSVEKFKDISTLCQKTTVCLGGLNCKQAEEAKKNYQEACDELELRVAEAVVCLGKFYTYVQREKYDCAKKLDFFTPDLSKQKTALTTGKACVLEIFEKECSKNSFAHFSNAKNYDKLVEVLTTKPNNEKCTGLHFRLQAMQCTEDFFQFETRSYDFGAERNKLKVGGVMNGTVAGIVADKCRAARKCISSHCNFNQEEKLAQINRTCKIIEPVEQIIPFMNCLGKLSKNNNKEVPKVVEPDCNKLKAVEGKLKKMMVEQCGAEIDGSYAKGIEYLTAICK